METADLTGIFSLRVENVVGATVCRQVVVVNTH